MIKGKFYFIFISVIIMAFLSSCEDDRGGAYMERMGMEGKKFTSFVIALDYGCHNCKDQFYKYVLEAYPEKCALIFKREPDAATLVNYQGLFSKKFVFIDSLDISFEMGITDKNTELALWENGKVKTFTFLEYEALIGALESTQIEGEN